jgi:peptidoglycan/xylan/chitin deacetylase (PgdA/CDA1 family)
VNDASWLPEGKDAAVCLSVDDVHPGRSADAYEAGGDLGEGVLGHVEHLLARHPRLRVTLFVTADWRERSPVPTRRRLARVPILRDRLYLAPTLRPGTMRLDRHPAFTEYLRSLPRTEVALHGLRHVSRGCSIPSEFTRTGPRRAEQAIAAAIRIFEAAGLRRPEGMCPPGWTLTPPLERALVRCRLRYVASARDVVTPVSRTATTCQSGLRGVSLIHPESIAGGSLIHITSNYQATSTERRAVEIVEAGGLLAIKAHAVKDALGHVAQDGLDEAYRDALSHLFEKLEERFGDRLWWTDIATAAKRASLHASS